MCFTIGGSAPICFLSMKAYEVGWEATHTYTCIIIKDYTAKLRSLIHFFILETSISCLKTSKSSNSRHC